jgi:hypothetical protein
MKITIKAAILFHLIVQAFTTISYYFIDTFALSEYRLLIAFDNAIDMSINSVYTVNISTAGSSKYYKFVASSTQTYTFSSSGSLDTYATLYSSSGRVITADDDLGLAYNFLITRQLTLGQTYFLGVRFYYSYELGSFTIKVV